MMNETITTILNRKSVREFADKQVDSAFVEVILRSAMSAPSARNRQPWKFVVVDDNELKVALADELPYAKMLKTASLGIVVCGDIRDKDDATAQTFWQHDCAAAIENILLACESLGLGAVWTACYPKQDRADVVSKHLELPDGVVPMAVIPIGYPLQDTPVVDKWKEDNIIYNKWKN